MNELWKWVSKIFKGLNVVSFWEETACRKEDMEGGVMAGQDQETFVHFFV